MGALSPIACWRNLLVIAQSAMMVLAFVLAWLVYTGQVQPWHIIAIALASGVANAFDAPARQAFVVDLVDRRDLTNAIALNSTMFNAAAVIGPALAGVVYALYGPVWCFTINGLSYIAVIVALLLMKLGPTVVRPKSHVNGVAAQGGRALYRVAGPDPYTDPEHGRDQLVWHEPDDAVAGLVGGRARRRRAHERIVAVGASAWAH